MNAGASERSWAVRLSIQLYRRLLVAYPQAFRREYGAHMVQVFGDCCREASHADGAVGLWRYWLMAFGDLMRSALAERRQQEMHMSRTAWVRLGSLAAMVGGSTAAIFALVGLVLAEAQLLAPDSPVARDLFAFQLTVWQVTGWEVAPVVWVLYLLALIGLAVRGASRGTALGWIGITTSVIGAFLIAAANGYWSALVYSYSQGSECTRGLVCGPYVPAALNVQLLATIPFAVGMILYGIAGLRQQVLRRWNGAPLLIGALALLSPASYIYAMRYGAGTDYVGQLRYMDYVGELRVDLVLGVLALVSAAAWIVLGMALFPRKEERAAPQAIPANGSVG
ncbi:MAG TPA: hypothetical protein VH393_16150 [Ktedonobacterales bacterium]|jgi:hypothetical protein